MVPVHIHLDNVRKTFPITGGEKVAVDAVNLKIDHGERIGIIGRNGSGKTTLLKMIAGLVTPTAGNVDVNGHVNCIMTLGVGLRELLSGRENIYIDGELNGRTRAEVDRVIDDIIAFADIGEFIDYPVKTYSTGMKARLAFSMIIFIEPEILIVDEILSVGDALFWQKASAKMKEICAKGKILIIVSHSLGSIVDMCNRCVWMDQGRIVMDGDPASVTEEYRKTVRDVEERKIRERTQRRVGAKSIDPNFAITGVTFLDGTGNEKHIFTSNEEARVRVTVRASVRLEQPDLAIFFEKVDGNILMENRASADGSTIEPIEGEAVFEIDMGPIMFGQDTYRVCLELTDRQRPPGDEILAYYNAVLKIEQPANIIDYPAYFADVRWSYKPIARSIWG